MMGDEYLGRTVEVIDGAYYGMRGLCTEWVSDTQVGECVLVRSPRSSVFVPTKFVKIVEEESQMIGKWYTVTDPESAYVNLTGECVDYDHQFGELTLKFPHKCKMRFTKDQLIHETIKEILDSVREESGEDMVKRPNHYQLLPEYEVKDINKALLDKIQESDFDMSLYEAGWYQQAMQYFLRFYAKGGVEDLEKGVETMQFVIDSLKEREGDE